MRPQVITTTTLVDDDNGVLLSQTLASSGALTLNGALVSGGVAYIYGTSNTTNQGQKLSIYGTGNNSGVVATIVGTDPGGAYQSATLTLANNGTATTTEYWSTITSITISAALSGNIIGGPLAAQGGATREFYLDRQQLPGNTSLTASLSSGGSATFTAQYSVTVRDPQSQVSYANTAVWQNVDGLAAVTATTSSNLAYDAVATRLLITANSSGTITYTAIQGNPY